MNFQETALSYLGSGLSVFPVGTDKRPTITNWSHLQKTIATKEEVSAWGERKGIAIVCGKVSGGLTCIDIDEKHDHKKTVSKEYFALLKEWGREDLLKRLVMEKTPSGGWHLVFRSAIPFTSEKLARDNGAKEAMIETKGEGGYFVCAPTPGWELKYGSFAKVETFDDEEASLLILACRELDRNPPPQSDPIAKVIHEGKSPFDDYNDRATAEDVAEMLLSSGWKRMNQRGQNIHFHRPGKPGKLSTSATLHVGMRTFYVYSTSTDFDAGKGYSPIAVYAITKHNGDFKAAAKELAGLGYGEKKEWKPKAKPVEPKVSTSESLDDLQVRLLKYYDDGLPKGLTTPWPKLTELMPIRKGLLTIVTGIPSHGKSSVVDQIMVHMADEYDWKIDLFSPEHFPKEVHARRLIQLKTKKSFFGKDRITREELKTESFILGKNFRWIDSPNDVSLDFIFGECANREIDALVIDPWNEVESARPRDVTESEYIGICLRKLRKFAREKNISVWVIAHPTKIQRQEKSDERKVPDLYDINGSANWYNKADNGIVVWRNFSEGFTEVFTQKIKFHWDGKIGSMKLKFNTDWGGYSELTASEDFLGHSDQKRKAGGDVL